MFFRTKSTWMAMVVVLISSWVLTACIQATPGAQTNPAPTNTNGSTGEQSVVSLLYQGPQEFGAEDPSKCTTFSLDNSQKATLGTCDGTSQIVDMGKRFALDWDDIQNRFASFVYETPTETLTFTGRGTISGEAWQRAILAWARMSHAELGTGRVSAAGRTVMSWYFEQLPDRDNVCAHLTVLNYGYAYADTVDCDEGSTYENKDAWLTDEEMAQLDTWLYGNTALYVDKNYLDGQGSTELSAADATAVADWATAVRARIWGE